MYRKIFLKSTARYRSENTFVESQNNYIGNSNMLGFSNIAKSLNILAINLRESYI